MRGYLIHRAIARAAIGLLVAATAMPAAAETPRQLAMGQIASVAAITVLCPTLKPNYAALTAIALPYGINMKEGSEDWLLIQARMKQSILTFAQSGGEIMACGTGRTLYGPGGLDVPNLMLAE